MVPNIREIRGKSGKIFVKSRNLPKNFKSPGCGEQRSNFDFKVVQMLAYCRVPEGRGLQKIAIPPGQTGPSTSHYICATVSGKVRELN